MRFLIIIHCLLLFGGGMTTFAHAPPSETTTENTATPAHDTETEKDIIAWKQHLNTFEELITTDSDAAVAELDTVAKLLFETHATVDEWKTLYLRLSRDKKGSISDMRRAAQLLIQMFTDLDAEKYKVQIQRYQQRIKYYDTLAKEYEDKGMPLETVEVEANRFQVREVWMDDVEALEKHVNAFTALLPTDKKAARAELDMLAKVQFGEHPLVKEWTDIMFQMSCDGKGLLTDHLKMVELELQMYRDVNPRKYAEHIAVYESGLVQLKSAGSMAEDPESLELDFHFGLKPKE